MPANNFDNFDNEREQLYPALLVLPRLRIQNANAISSPLTYGFPAITQFTGFMTALNRALGVDSGIEMQRVGVICHEFEAQVSSGVFTKSFHLTRNPLTENGSTAAIVEEGRASLVITLVFEVKLAESKSSNTAVPLLAAKIWEVVQGMRIAGGSVIPALHGNVRQQSAKLMVVQEDSEKRIEQFRELSRQWLPGTALVSRDDLLQSRLTQLQVGQPGATLLDAWLDLSRLNYTATRIVAPVVADQAADVNEVNLAAQAGEADGADEADDDDDLDELDDADADGDADADDADKPVKVDAAEWKPDVRIGWTVPIPVGFASVCAQHPQGVVANARSREVPFQFVECVYSIGQWVSPHRLSDIDELMWEAKHCPETGLYRCVNNFKPSNFFAPSTD